MERKPEALSAAFFDAKAKIEKIKQLNITVDMSIEAQDLLVEDLATAKALENGGKVADYRKGQAWYVESLVEFAGMSNNARLEHCYTRKFAEQANEAEMLDALDAMEAQYEAVYSYKS